MGPPSPRIRTFKHLNDDILTHIFSLLPLRTRLRCTLVCRRWCRFARLVSTNELVQVPNKPLNITRLGFSVWGKNIRSLHITTSNLILGDTNYIYNILESCPELERLVIAHTHQSDVFEVLPVLSCPSLTSLVLESKSASVVNSFLGLEALVQLTNLKRLEFPKSITITEEDVETIALCTSLEQLKVRTESSVSLDPLWELSNLGSLVCNSQSLPDDISCWPLTSLRLEDSPQHIDFLLTTPHLRSLTIEHASYITSFEDVEPLGACKYLTFVFLGELKRATTLEPLSECTKLRHLELHAAYNLLDISFLRSCNQLTTLKITDANKLADLGPVGNCTQLEVFNTTCHRCKNVGLMVACKKLCRFMLAYSGVEEDMDWLKRLPNITDPKCWSMGQERKRWYVEGFPL